MITPDPSSPAPKRRGRKPASSRKAKPAPPPIPEDVEIEIVADDLLPRIDPETGALEIPHEDGSILVDFNGDQTQRMEKASKHDANLALALDDFTLGQIAEDLLEGISSDDQSRSEWLEARAKGIDMLGLKIESPKSGVSTNSAPLEGMSVVRDPVMLEAVLRFQANAQGELLPSAGPVKAVNYGEGDVLSDRLAEALEKDLNFYLTTTATEYYPDSRRMFFWTGFSGLAFKKVYRCPLRRRPVSESVDATDLIVSDAITDLRNASRITHQISMRKSTMRRMQILGVYADVDLTAPQPDTNAVKEKIAKVQGVSLRLDRPQDQPFTVYECYCELDIQGFEHKEKGKSTGLPLPYRVTIEKDSRKILEIRRNWDEQDADYQAKIPFVAFPYATGLGFYGIGLLHILGNLANAITALTREAIDAGMFANFPGFLHAKSTQRQMTNEFRVPPGGGLPIETDGKPIRDMVMPLPYKEAGPAMIQLMEMLRGVAQRVGGTAETPVGEGKQDAPVGTTLAMIEQATKIEGAVHKALHAAQSEEFKLLCDLFRDDPEALWRGNRRPALAMGGFDKVQLFKAALDRCDIVPKADPNVPSHMHRVMKATAIKQLAAASPGLYDPAAVDKRVMAMINVDRPEELMAPPAPAQQEPPPEMQIKAAELALKGKELEQRDRKLKMDAVEKQKDRQSRQNIEVLKLASSLAVHPESNEIVDNQIMELTPFLNPISRPAVGLGLLGRAPPMRFMPPPQPRPPVMGMMR